MIKNLLKTILPADNEGLLLVDKPKGKTSFSLISVLRKQTHIQKIGHAGTLDPLATGLMIILIGKSFTRLSEAYIQHEKEYDAQIHLGSTTDTYDAVGKILTSSSIIPSLQEVETALLQFQGFVQQIPPMFSAKKIKGKKLYELARKGIEIERKPQSVHLKITLIEYTYPCVHLNIVCSKGTYIRSIAQDLGQLLTCGAYLSELRRTRCGEFHVKDSLKGELLYDDCG